MRLLYITYKVDSSDSLVGHVVGWIRGLSGNFLRIEVICLTYSGENLPENVRVYPLVEEGGISRFRRSIKFFQIVWKLRNSVQTVFCQFSPEYVIGIAPFAILRSWPIVLWYTHRQVSWRLRFATLLSKCVVTASPESFRIKSKKTTIIGHGINTDQFKPALNVVDIPSVILSVGRLSPIKNYELLIDAVVCLREMHGKESFVVRIVGGDEGNAPQDYRSILQARIDKSGLGDIVKLVGPIPFGQIVSEYANASAHINLCATGGMDKAVLEGMACGVPTLVLNESFASMANVTSGLELLNSDDITLIADQLLKLIRIPEGDRKLIGTGMWKVVNRSHGQEKFLRVLAETIQQFAD